MLITCHVYYMHIPYIRENCGCLITGFVYVYVNVYVFVYVYSSVLYVHHNVHLYT